MNKLLVSNSESVVKFWRASDRYQGRQIVIVTTKRFIAVIGNVGTNYKINQKTLFLHETSQISVHNHSKKISFCCSKIFFLENLRSLVVIWDCTLVLILQCLA